MKKQEALSGILVDSFLGLQHFAQMSRNKIDIQGFIPGPATHGILFQVQDFSSAIFYDTSSMFLTPDVFKIYLPRAVCPNNNRFNRSIFKNTCFHCI